MEVNKYDPDYKKWLFEIKNRLRTAQIKAAISSSTILIEFYWELGKSITEKQANSKWGDKLLDQLSFDLKEEFPEFKGSSVRNLKYARQFYQFYSPAIGQQAVAQLPGSTSKPTSKSTSEEFRQQLVAQIPWGHNILIITKIKNTEEANFYAAQTIENAWSRDVLATQIKTNLYNRQGKAITNFKTVLPAPMSDLAQQTLKDPYVFDFLTLDQSYKEKDIENQLVAHVTKFLLELGKGFAFIGRQYHLEIDNTDYYIDLLFYHVTLKCYVVIELKNTKFIPEYAGKLNFYLSAVDSIVKQPDDKPTIGILLCRDKSNVEAEFALRDINKPMGVSEFQFTEILPDSLKSSLPTIEELENELKNID